MIIQPIPILKDNYVWLLRIANTCLIVDPGVAAPVLDYIASQALQLKAILITHHHGDHIGGVTEIVNTYPVPVFGPTVSNLSCVSNPVAENALVECDAFPSFKVLVCPGHTLDHIAYYTPGHLLCGDTLFSVGCGRLFEGTYEQLYTSLRQFAALPAETLVYCTHEYTLQNCQFALKVEPQNIELQKYIERCQALRNTEQPTLPSSIATELAINPFLRCDKPSVIQAAENYAGEKLGDALAVFTVLRQWKNNA